MSKVYPALLKRFTIRLIRSENDFLNFIYQIAIEFWITNTLLHKFYETDMIFFYLFKVPTIKFGNCFKEFIIPIALFNYI